MRRHYDQPCSLAGALDMVGERWSLLIVRELLLGPVRFSELARGVGGAPTDVLTKRLRDLERDGVVRRRQLDPPASATVYELTDLGRELEPAVIALGRWGMNFYNADSVAELHPSLLPSSLKVILRPPADAQLTLGLRSRDRSFRLRIEGGEIAVERGAAADADLSLAGEPRDVVAALVDEAGEDEVEIEGDRGALAELRAMVVLPDRLRAEALALIGASEPAAV